MQKINWRAVLLALIMVGLLLNFGVVTEAQDAVDDVSEAVEVVPARTLDTLIAGLIGVIGVLLAIVSGMGVAVARSVPFRIGMTLAVNAMRLTPGEEDDAQLKRLLAEHGLYVDTSSDIWTVIPESEIKGDLAG